VFIYLWRKVVCFVLQLWDPLNWDASDCVLAGFGKFLTREGCMGLVPCRLDLQCKSSWILNDFLMKMKLNHSWKFQRNWNVPLVLLERSRWAGFNGIYLVRFGFRMWEILIFKWFLLMKIQLNSKTPGFDRKNQLRNVITLEPMAQATLICTKRGLDYGFLQSTF
jgi:hypothetical protein